MFKIWAHLNMSCWQRWPNNQSTNQIYAFFHGSRPVKQITQTCLLEKNFGKPQLSDELALYSNSECEGSVISAPYVCCVAQSVCHCVTIAWELFDFRNCFVRFVALWYYLSYYYNIYLWSQPGIKSWLRIFIWQFSLQQSCAVCYDFRIFDLLESVMIRHIVSFAKLWQISQTWHILGFPKFFLVQLANLPN